MTIAAYAVRYWAFSWVRLNQAVRNSKDGNNGSHVANDKGGIVEDPFRTIEWKDDHIRLLEQTLLPHEEVYVEIRTVRPIV